MFIVAVYGKIFIYHRSGEGTYRLLFMSPDYIVGLTDGEGCFYIGIRFPKGLYKTVRVEPHFYIKLREDDLFLLQKVQKTLKCGAIYFQKEKRINHSACYRYEVNTIKNLNEIIIPFFDKYPLLGRKYKSFLIFKEIVDLVSNNKHKTSEGINKIIKLKETMNK